MYESADLETEFSGGSQGTTAGRWLCLENNSNRHWAQRKAAVLINWIHFRTRCWTCSSAHRYSLGHATAREGLNGLLKVDRQEEGKKAHQTPAIMAELNRTDANRTQSWHTERHHHRGDVRNSTHLQLLEAGHTAVFYYAGRAAPYSLLGATEVA